MVTGKPVYQFPTGSRFSECITGYQIYRTSHRHDPRNANADILRHPERHCLPFSRNSSVVGNVWTSVLATGRLSTSAVHVCCPNTWTVLYFWMEISNYWVGLAVDFVRQSLWRFSVMQWQEVGQYYEQTDSHMCVAHRHRPNSQQQLHEVTNAHRPTCTGDHRAIQHTQITLKHELQLHVCHNSHIRLKLCHLYFAHSWRRGWPADAGDVCGQQRFVDHKI